MLLTTIRDEFVFNCQCRKLSERTTKNYQKQITYNPAISQNLSISEMNTAEIARRITKS
jgi:hypothetical protein